MKSLFNKNNIFGSLIKEIRNILYTARSHAASSVNTAMLNANWSLGARIVEGEQQGKIQAEYGTASLDELFIRLTMELGKLTHL